MVSTHWKLVALGLASMLYVSQAQAGSVHSFPKGNNDGFKSEKQDDKKPDQKEEKKVDKKEDRKEEKGKTESFLGDKNPIKWDCEWKKEKDCRDVKPKDFCKRDDDKKCGEVFHHKKDHKGDCHNPCDDKPECPPAVPLPPAVWTGMATMAGAAWTMRKRFNFLSA